MAEFEQGFDWAAYGEELGDTSLAVLDLSTNDELPQDERLIRLDLGGNFVYVSDMPPEERSVALAEILRKLRED